MLPFKRLDSGVGQGGAGEHQDVLHCGPALLHTHRVPVWFVFIREKSRNSFFRRKKSLEKERYLKSWADKAGQKQLGREEKIRQGTERHLKNTTTW